MQIYYKAYVKAIEDNVLPVWRVTFKTASEDGYESQGYVDVVDPSTAEEIAALYRERGALILTLLVNYVYEEDRA